MPHTASQAGELSRKSGVIGKQNGASVDKTYNGGRTYCKTPLIQDFNLLNDVSSTVQRG